MCQVASTTNSSAVDRYFDLIGHQIFQGNYAEAVINCERLLNYLPKNAPQRVDVLDQLGTAQAMLQNFPQSYAAYSEALSLDPNDAALWLNRGMASRFTSRFGRSLRDYERARYSHWTWWIIRSAPRERSSGWVSPHSALQRGCFML
jgi:tetratricopeptide (TPR) repeat protein